MKITIYQNREVYKEESKIGNDSENKVETLKFEFPEEYEDFTKYIEFQIKGEKYVDLIEDNKYVITREVAKYGKIKTQVVLKKNTENDVMIFKSDIFTLNVSNSINATENLVHTVGIDLIEKIITKNNEQDTRLNNLELDNTTNKENISNLQNDNTTNKTNIKSLQDDNEVNKTDISNIKQEQTTQNTNIQELQTDNTSNKAKILDLEDKNTEQDTNIQMNTEEIAQIKEKNTAQDKLIEELQAENTKLKKEINSMQVPGEEVGNPIHLTDSSDMECEIVPIGGAEQETRSGKNKLQLYFSDKTASGVTITKNKDDSITLNGTATANINFMNLGKFLYEVAKGTFKGNHIYKSGSITGAVGIYFSDSTTLGNNKGGTTLETKNKSFNLSSTVTEDTNIYPYIYINSGVVFDNFTFYFQVVNSDTDDFDYEPYGASPSPGYPSPIQTVGQNGSVEIEVCNEDLFDKNAVTLGYINSSGSIISYADWRVSDYITVKPLEIYTYGNGVCTNNGRGVYHAWYDKDKKLMSTFPHTETTKPHNITVPDGAKYLRLSVYTHVHVNDLDVLMLVHGTELPTNYIEHKSYTKVLPIQEEMLDEDYISDKEYHNWGKLIITGNEGIGKSGVTKNNSFWINSANVPDLLNAEILNYVTLGAVKPNIISNYFVTLPPVKVVDNNNVGISICANNNLKDITIRFGFGLNSEINTVEKCAAFLKSLYDAGTPVIVYYKLATPKSLELIEEQKSVLNSFYTYKGITNISVDGIGTLKVNYKKDLETIINKLSATSVAE